MPGAADATRTVVLRYRAKNGLRFFEDHDELYWNVTGDEWDVPIEAASARIVLPAGATGVRAIAFNGAYGSTAQDAKVAIEGTAVRVVHAAAARLSRRAHRRRRVGQGTGRRADRRRPGAGLPGEQLAARDSVVVLLGMFALWRRVGRDPGRLPVAVQYEPPDALTPAEAGTLIDESADMRDITATVVDLAVRGYLRIEEREEKLLLGLIDQARTTSSTGSSHRPGRRPLETHESRVLDGIFESGSATVKLSDLENEFYQHLSRRSRRASSTGWSGAGSTARVRTR